MLLNQSYSISNIRKQIVGINKKVLLSKGKKVRYTYLDNAASTPTLVPVLDKVTEFLHWYSSIHRGTGYKSKVSTKIYEEAHEIISSFVHSDINKNTIIFVKNTTEAINKLSYRLNLDKNDIVILSVMEHHSNDLPWREKCRTEHIDILSNGRLNIASLEHLLKLYKGRVKLVSITGASNVTGYVNDIHKIASLAHNYGAKVMIDAAQLAPHRGINMSGNNSDDYLDFIAFSGHKMYAPFGTGVLIGPKEVFEFGAPDYVGGGTIISVTKYNTFWGGLPDKEEAGTPNVVGAVALAKAVKVLEEIGMDNIKAREAVLTRYFIKELNKIPDVTVYSKSQDESLSDMVGVVSIGVKGIPPNLLASALAYEGGIGVRSGCFCAHPYIHKLLNMSTREISLLQKDLISGDYSTLPGLVRISFGVYNSVEDINIFLQSLKKIIIAKKDILGLFNFDLKTGEYTPKLLHKPMFYDFSI